MKRSIRSVAKSLLRRGRNTPDKHIEQPEAFYDEVFRSSPLYTEPFFKAPWYPLWTMLSDRIVLNNHESVLDIGCGPGQFASLLWYRGVRNYCGVDFSEASIEAGNRLVPDFRFIKADARVSKIYDEYTHDVLVCSEVLEHVEDDLAIVCRFKPGVRCLCSVPSYWSKAHVRVFKDHQAVIDRYGAFFHDMRVDALPFGRRTIAFLSSTASEIQKAVLHPTRGKSCISKNLASDDADEKTIA